MKLIILCFALSIGICYPNNNYSQTTKVSLHLKNKTIRQIFTAIEQRSEYVFFYQDDIVDVNRIVSVDATEKKISQILDEILGATNNGYFVSDRQIYIVRKADLPSLRAKLAADVPQERQLSGSVRNSSGEALAGVTITANGSGRQVQTDDQGHFELAISSEDTQLSFRNIGYKAYTHTLTSSNTITIVLENEVMDLDELVVVGYGRQKRAHLTGSVSQVTSQELTRAPMQNLSNMLTGKLPGLTSIQRSGKPGDDGTALYIRGLNSFAGNNGPMILVDGVSRPIDYINPNDVESISVLKDAAASIYGVQGANGVILITTKKGSSGKTQINYDGAGIITMNTAMPDFLDARDYMYWNNKAREMDGLTPIWTAAIQNKVLRNDPNSIYGETNWLDKIFRVGVANQHNVSASGGTDQTRYFASLGVMDQEGTIINTDYRRYNVRTNLDIEVAKNLKFTAILAGMRSDRNWPGTPIGNQTEFNPVRQAINAIPIIKSEYNGLPTAWNGSAYNVNAHAALTESGFIKQTRWVMDSNFKLEYDFSALSDALRNLKVSMFGSYNYGNTTDANFSRYYELYALNSALDEGVVGASGFSSDNTFSKSASWGDSYLWRPQIDYSREFGRHYVGAMFLFETKKSYSETMTGAKRGYVTDDPVDLSLGSTFETIPVTGSHVYSGGQASYVGRLNYSYDERYMAEAAFRYDGSYIFAPGNQWGFFPSASAGWVISQEDFFSGALSTVNLLKLRASYGRSGNDAVSPFLDNALFALSTNSMVFGGEAISQFYSTNPYLYRNLRWATTDSYNMGLDIDLWGRKFGIEADVFYKLTKDILESQGGNYPPSLGGYYPTFVNSGKVENRGFEVILKHFNQVDENWQYAVKGSFAFARNRVLSRIITDDRPNYRAVIGESMNARYGFRALGLFQTQEEIDNYPAAPSGFIRLGDLKYEDINGDGIISSEFDYVKMGYGTVPEINFALDLNVSYKNFNLAMLWQGVSRVDYELSGMYDTGVISSTLYTSAFSGNGNSPSYLIKDAWTPENTDAKYPRLSTISNGNNAWQSSWWLVNGEYIRLKNLNFSYSIPPGLLGKAPFSQANIFVSGSNLLTLSHFKYVDPESPSVSNGYYPQQKTFSFGLNITF